MAKERNIRRARCKKCGVCIQTMICICNGLIWIISVALIGLGLVLGLSSKTIGIGDDFNFLDWLITTPATIFIFYGLLLFIIGIWGCFASISGNGCCTLFYTLLIGGFVAFDVLFGLAIAFSFNFYENFLENMIKSQNGYDDKNAKPYGIIPFNISPHPQIFWDHFQNKGECCGLRKYLEWRKTPFGTNKKHIPESCCNSYFKYYDCGELIWDHQEVDWHNRLSVIYKIGCIEKFPRMLRGDPYHVIDFMGKGIITLLLFCFVLALVLTLLVICRAFRPSHGLANPGFENVPDEVECRCGIRRAYRKVAPETNSTRVKAVSFDEKGPTYLPPPPASR